MSTFFVFALVANMFFFVPQAKACWGCAIAAELLGQALDTIKRQLEGALLGTLKVTANAVLSSQVSQMIGGNSVREALIVTDWNDFIYKQPAAEVNLYMNDFLTQSTRGTHSSNNYVEAEGIARSVGGNYPAYLVDTTKQALGMSEGSEMGGLAYDLDQYCESPDVIFNTGNFMCLSSFMSNPGNNPYGFTMVAAAVKARKMDEKIEEAKTKAQSSGFVGKTDKNGRTITPAATVEAMLSDVQNIGNTMIASATNPGEFLTGVVSAVVNKAVTGIVQKGVGKIQASIQKEVNQLSRQARATLNGINKDLGPAAKFTKEWSQKTDIYAKPYTQPPPTARDSGVNCGGAC